MSESSCVEQSLFRVALLALVCQTRYRVNFPTGALNPPVTAQGPNGERRPQIAAQSFFTCWTTSEEGRRKLHGQYF